MAALISWKCLTSIIAHHTLSSCKSYLRLVVNYWYQFIFTITFFCPCWFFCLGANVWLNTHFVVYTVRYTWTQTPTCSALFSAHLKVTGVLKVCGSIPTVCIMKSPWATCWCVSSFWAVGQWNPLRRLFAKSNQWYKKKDPKDILRWNQM